MKNLIFFFAMATLFSCQNYHCPEFDASHQINKWSWFPDSKLSYLYTNEANEEKSLVQTHHRKQY